MFLFDFWWNNAPILGARVEKAPILVVGGGGREAPIMSANHNIRVSFIALTLSHKITVSQTHTHTHTHTQKHTHTDSHTHTHPHTHKDAHNHA